jgi:hypothetical protein
VLGQFGRGLLCLRGAELAGEDHDLLLEVRDGLLDPEALALQLVRRRVYREGRLGRIGTQRLGGRLIDLPGQLGDLDLGRLDPLAPPRELVGQDFDLGTPDRLRLLGGGAHS